MDSLVSNSMYLRNILGLPEKESEETVDDTRKLSPPHSVKHGVILVSYRVEGLSCDGKFTKKSLMTLGEKLHCKFTIAVSRTTWQL